MLNVKLKRKLGYTVAFSGTVIATMHIINRLFNYLATADHLLFKDEYYFYEWRFGRIAYKKQGKGTPLLLIHDLNVCASSYEWNSVIDELSKRHTVYAIDLLGCGRSEQPAFTYTNYLYAQLISDFIKAIIGKKTDVIASGESSAIILTACSIDDSMIDRIIMINPPNMVTLAKNPTKSSEIIRYLIATPVIGTFIYNMRVNKKTIRENLFSTYYYNQNNIREKDILVYFESSHINKTRSKYLYASQKSRFTNFNISHCLKNRSNSICIIIGNENPENALSANQYQNIMPSIEIMGIDQTKKMPHMEKPKQVCECISLFLEDDNMLKDPSDI